MKVCVTATITPNSRLQVRKFKQCGAQNNAALDQGCFGLLRSQFPFRMTRNPARKHDSVSLRHVGNLLPVRRRCYCPVTQIPILSVTILYPRAYHHGFCVYSDSANLTSSTRSIYISFERAVPWFNSQPLNHTTSLTVTMAPRVSTIDILVLVLSLVAFLVVRGYRRRRGLPYPPGPRPLPLIGNLLDIPKEFSWLEYTQLSKKYGMGFSPVKLLLIERMPGDVLCLHVFGKVIVILNSVKATKDLLEKRGDIYSDRPAIPMYEMYVFSEVSDLAWFLIEAQDEVGMARAFRKIHRVLASSAQVTRSRSSARGCSCVSTCATSKGARSPHPTVGRTG